MARDTSLRPGSRRTYSMAEYGHSEQGARQGKHVLKNALADYWALAWGDGVTTVRPFPVRNPEDPNQWEPYRLSLDPGNWGDWIRRYPAVRSMGEPGVTFIIRDPADPNPVDPATTPGWMLFNAIDRAVANGQDQQGWAALLRGGRNRGAQLSRPSEIYLIQCMIVQHKQKIYMPPDAMPRGFGPEDKLVVLELSSNAGVNWLTQLDQVREGYTGDPADYEHSMVHGDPVSLQHGRFVTWYKLTDGDPRSRQNVAATGFNQPVATHRGQPGALEPIGYGVFQEDAFRGVPARLADFEQQVAAKVRPWDDLLHFPTLEEQAQLLSDKFPAEIIMYAWRDRPEWITEAVRRRAVGSHSVAVPGMPGSPWGGQQPLYGSVGGLVPPLGPGVPPGQFAATPPAGQQFAAAPQQFAPPAQPQPVAALPGWGASPSQPQQQPQSQPQSPPQFQHAPVQSPPAGFGAVPQGSAVAGPQQPAYPQQQLQYPVQQPGPVVDPAVPAGTMPAMPHGAFGTPMAPPAAPPVIPPTAPVPPPAPQPAFQPQSQPQPQPTPAVLVAPPAAIQQPVTGFAPPPPVAANGSPPTRAALALAAAQAAVAAGT